MGAASVDLLNAGTLSRDLLSLSSLLRSGNAAAKLPESQPPAPQAASPSTPADPAAVEDQFNLVTYSSRVQRLSLAAQFQEVAARFADGENGSTAEVQAQQLSFDFFFESRAEELAVFQERTATVADGLEGTQQSSYLATSQRVAARFHFSMTLSGAALNGFANASESAEGNEDLLDQLIGLTQRFLDAGNEFLNEFLNLFNGSTTETDPVSFEDLFQRLVQEFLGSLGDAGLPALAGNGGGSSNGASVQAASIQLEFNFEFSAEVTVEQAQVVQQSDPIILDLDNDGFELSNYQQGARFDILGNGQQAQVAFVTGGDAFLAIDRNGDGLINSGQELFGDQLGAANGYEELRKLDSNSDGAIDNLDQDFAQLRLFRDNGNGITEEGELITLAEAGVAELSLNYLNTDQAASGGNRLTQLAAYRRTDGAYGQAADAVLNYLA